MPIPRVMPIADYLRYMVEAGASDLHVKVGLPPVVRVDGVLLHSPFEALTPQDTADLAKEVLLTDRKRQEFERDNEVDTGFSLQGVGRFRINAYRQRGEVSVAVRRVYSEIPTFEELRLPPVITQLVQEPRGLVLVTGPTGTGKTTTIASMIGWINANRRLHIVTIEDPIEVVHDDLECVVEQREIGLDTDSYGTALRHVVRQDPDVIFIGEIRDLQTAEAAVQAAETGHLVISTLHTLDATETVNRIIDMYPPAVQRQAHRPCGRAHRRPRRDVLDPRGHFRRRLLWDAELRPGPDAARGRGAGHGGGGAGHGVEPPRPHAVAAPSPAHLSSARVACVSNGFCLYPVNRCRAT